MIANFVRWWICNFAINEKEKFRLHRNNSKRDFFPFLKRNIISIFILVLICICYLKLQIRYRIITMANIIPYSHRNIHFVSYKIEISTLPLRILTSLWGHLKSKEYKEKSVAVATPKDKIRQCIYFTRRNVD